MMPMPDATPLYAEHPLDVLRQWLAWRREGPAALVVISDTDGGSVRSRGALMAVSPDGRRCGYISGGCVDADVALRAREALDTNRAETLRYGTGSPFIDMPLPCGGAIELMIFPDADGDLVRTCCDRLAAREPATLPLPGLAHIPAYFPKLRVRISGRGADALALGRLVRTSGYELVLQLRDGEDVEEARRAGLEPANTLQSPASLPPLTDDPWTAFVLMFHDLDWETALLKQALEGPAFYVGSVGSRRAQARRRETLRAMLGDAAPIGRLRGPVGLVPSLRDASMLAVSTLAEIVGAYRQALHAGFGETAVLLLAAGQSRRFGHGDKLLAPLDGKPIIAHAAGALSGEAVAARIAVTGPGQDERRALLEAAGWHVLTNPDAASGQASSIRTGIMHLSAIDRVRHVLILLADMPFVPDAHFRALQAAVADGTPAALSVSGGVEGPPAIFGRDTFPALMALKGDAGARSVYRASGSRRTVELDARCAIDVDTADDLARASETLKA